jgi:hypothetical protein
MRHLHSEGSRRTRPALYYVPNSRGAHRFCQVRRDAKAQCSRSGIARCTNSIPQHWPNARPAISGDSSYACKIRLSRIFVRDETSVQDDKRAIKARTTPGACASDSRAGFGAQALIWGGKLGLADLFAMQMQAKGTFRENSFITMAYGEILQSVACYLCNTFWKTGCLSPFEAVPLLRVHWASVIVIRRRRGASRGRPGLGGSLKSLAFSGCVRRREAAKR